MLINFHEELLGIIKLDASSREAGQDSGTNSSTNGSTMGGRNE
jgi:hypothetical protein